MLDIPAGNLSDLNAVDGKLLFIRHPNSETIEGATTSLDYYDFEEREVKTILQDVSEINVTANGQKVMVTQGDKLAVLKIDADQKIDKTVPNQNMIMKVVPKEE